MLPEIIVDETPALADRLAGLFEAEGRRAITDRGRFAVALSGGSVATTFFPRLARLSFDWSRTAFFWCDERAVPPSDPDSNYAAARAAWLDPAAVPAPNVHRMEAEGRDLTEAAAAHADHLVRILGDRPRLDLVLLGAGPDGHVASLFPGHAALGEEERMVLAVEDSPKPPPRRLTLTLPVLAGARTVVVPALGRSKAQVVREAVEDPGSRLPLALVTRRASRIVYLLDAEAAGALASRG